MPCCTPGKMQSSRFGWRAPLRCDRAQHFMATMPVVSQTCQIHADALRESLADDSQARTGYSWGARIMLGCLVTLQASRHELPDPLMRLGPAGLRGRVPSASTMRVRKAYLRWARLTTTDDAQS